jgi:hypothetical protein
MATTQIPPRADNDNDPAEIVSFGQRKALRDLPRYLRAEAL